MKVVILAGGFGTRISEESQYRPKPMLEIGGKNDMVIHNQKCEPWKVTVVDTGLHTMTGGRIKRVQPYVGSEPFMMTYGDAVCDVDIGALLDFHRQHGKLATLTAVTLAQDKGVLDIDWDNTVRAFREKLPKEPGRRGRVRMAAVVLLGCCFLNQASFINYFLDLNHRRSEQEHFIIQQIGPELDKREDTEKPVIFVGRHSTDSHIVEAASLPADSLRWKVYRQLCLSAMELAGIDPASQPISRKIPDTILNSMIQWAMWSFESTMPKMFNYYGFDFVPASRSLYDEAAAYAEESGMPSYPCDGYVEDVGSYVIVNLH